MRFESIRVRGLGPFKKEVAIDLTQITGTLVAFCGVNGAGKSTLLELLCGALFRQTATRGTLAELATTRDAFVEVRCVNGKALTIRQSVDALNGKGESLVLDAAGVPLLESAKVSEYKRWAAAHLMAPEVLYSSSVAVQRSYGFLDLGRTERVAVLNRALGTERYERMAKAASERAKTERAKAEELRRRIAEVPENEVPYLRTRLANAESNVAAAVEATKSARLAHQRAQAAAADVARAMELAEQRRAAVGRMETARARLTDLETRLGKNRDLLGRSAEVRAAVVRSEDLRAQMTAAELACTAAQAESERIAVTVRSLERAVEEQRRMLAGTKARVEQVERRLLDRPRIEAAAGEAERLRSVVASRDEDVLRLRADVERLTQLTLDGKDRRISGLRTGLEEIARGMPSWEDLAQSALESDSELAARLSEAPTLLAQRRREHAEAAQAAATLRLELRTAEQLAARTGEMLAAAADLETARDAHAAAYETAGGLDLDLKHQRVHLAAADTAWSDARAASPALRDQLDRLAPTVALAQHLDQAEGRIEAYEAELPTVRATLAAAEAELAALPDVSQPEAVDLAALERQATRAEAFEQEARAVVVRCTQAVEAAEQAAQKRAALEVELRGIEDEQADWTRLAQDLGRDGLQALEIDAALPELNTVANELLASCVGTRFAVELRSDRLTSDGKTVEALEARVIDTQEGRDADASTYSPGELVIVSEAIALALTTRACRQNGVERPTLIRDETGAALSTENGRAYIRMLRRAAALIGADKCLFVTHSLELQELADVRVEISADHQITIGGVA